ncbi:OLC1v1023638C1 [Oldenlandia corymbosa var. corymbosa]|uniref:OLC1v1023638C1 n=1 Tax=Oldenlandia corymbosa var. corymbosa TaxID=529605 RepID=A0AAV1C0F9_OLDCO|nr:OLC1v1023638C1 [Oldenlandia corymbosa var. corymbosa]
MLIKASDVEARKKSKQDHAIEKESIVDKNEVVPPITKNTKKAVTQQIKQTRPTEEMDFDANLGANLQHPPPGREEQRDF